MTVDFSTRGSIQTAQMFQTRINGRYSTLASSKALEFEFSDGMRLFQQNRAPTNCVAYIYYMNPKKDSNLTLNS